eukprot:3849053-Ditylum_brightwellii.AAC.1
MLLQVPITWSDQDQDITLIQLLENPKTAKHWKTVETSHEVLFYLKLRNRLHFGQTKGTPFMVPLLLVEIDWAAKLITFELVLEGNYSKLELAFIQQNYSNIVKGK